MPSSAYIANGYVLWATGIADLTRPVEWISISYQEDEEGQDW